MTDIQKQLEGLGLADKEVKVYLASLELGPATAQQLAAKAAVVRPSAYVAIGGLVKKGLMSQFTKGKKQYFSAEKPDHLMHLLQEEKKNLATRESQLKSVLPMLESLVAISGEKPEVKYYEGVEGLEAMRKTLFESGAKTLDVVGFQSIYRKNGKLPEGENTDLYEIRKKRSKIRHRQINLGAVGQDWKPMKNPNAHYKSIQTSKGNYNSEIAVFDDCVTIINFHEKPVGYLIKSKDIAALVRLLFETAWHSKDAKDIHV